MNHALHANGIVVITWSYFVVTSFWQILAWCDYSLAHRWTIFFREPKTSKTPRLLLCERSFLVTGKTMVNPHMDINHGDHIHVHGVAGKLPLNLSEVDMSQLSERERWRVEQVNIPSIWDCGVSFARMYIRMVILKPYMILFLIRFNTLWTYDTQAKVREKHKGHEKMHLEMLLVLITTLAVGSGLPSIVIHSNSALKKMIFY